MCKRMYYLSFLFVILTVMAGSNAWAQELPPGARALGMGGAMTAVGGDSTAIFYNPAALAVTPLMDVRIAAGASSRSPAEIVAYLQADLRAEDEDDLPEAGSEFAAGVSASVNMAQFGLGLNRVQVARVEERQQGKTAEIRTTGTGYLGLTKSYPGLRYEPLSMGVNLKYSREHLYHSSLTGTTRLKEKELGGEKYGLDFGLIQHFGPHLRLGFMFENLLAPAYTLSGTADLGDEGGRIDDYRQKFEQPLTLSLGAAFHPPILGGTVAGSVENTMHEGNHYPQARFGYERGLLLEFITLRAGAVAAFGEKPLFCGGAGVNLGFMNLDLGLAGSGGIERLQTVQISGNISF